MKDMVRGAAAPWRSEVLALVASLAFLLACNGPFWRALLQGRDLTALSTWLFAAGVGLSLGAWMFVLLALVLNRYSAKPLLALLIVATAVATYYMGRYGVFLDPSMLRNVLRTDWHEARELLGSSLLLHLLLYAALPLALLVRVRVARRSLARSALHHALAVALGLVVAVAALWAVFQDFSALTRNRKELRYLITPGNYLWSLGVVTLADTAAAVKPRERVGTDAARGPLAARPGRKPALLVLVVGETARAANWGLNGYARATTPELAAQPDLINFSRATSCGTNTEVSLPCMFSPWGRRQYDERRIRGAESLLHVLQRAGVGVYWRDNQSGCKGVCDGIANEVLRPDHNQALCDGERCLDEALLQDLADRARARAGDQLIVLHQLGNHGPAYYKRYPAAFRRFAPTCDSAELHRCTREQIVNTYDNAILYTDHVLAQAIERLRTLQSSHDTALIYLSDHGESLGENGLFLHGLPYAIAPAVQTEVPMLMWLSPGFAGSFDVDADCLRQRAAQPVSHDHLFHTVLGLLDVSTSVREAALDLAQTCRKAAARSP